MQSFNDAENKAQEIVNKLKDLSLKITLAESCTAGLASALLAGTGGASSVLWGSFVCYTKEAKVSMLGIDEEKLALLVSEKTALLMAEAALKKSGADIAVSVTGIAGPDGDGGDVPVGTVWIGVAVKNEKTAACLYHFKGNRNEIRLKAASAIFDSLQKILDALTKH
ncbi:MAG: CinA family protein [Treponema sp.]|nr:CinA family protein [Treponema sp.]MCL2271887.1 CinA family protein [Treponema sp.]